MDTRVKRANGVLPPVSKFLVVVFVAAAAYCLDLGLRPSTGPALGKDPRGWIIQYPLFGHAFFMELYMLAHSLYAYIYIYFFIDLCDIRWIGNRWGAPEAPPVYEVSILYQKCTQQLYKKYKKHI